MGNDKYYTLMNLGRIDLAIRLGWIRPMLQKKWKPAVIAVHILHRQELKCFQEFELRTRVIFFDKHFIWMEQVFECKGIMAAIAISKLTATDKQGIAPVASKLGLSQQSLTNPLAERVIGILNDVGLMIRDFSKIGNHKPTDQT
jgi:acyl-CoA thioesterase FadM